VNDWPGWTVLVNQAVSVNDWPGWTVFVYQAVSVKKWSWWTALAGTGTSVEVCHAARGGAGLLAQGTRHRVVAVAI
jgi:hypothetical protein